MQVILTHENADFDAIASLLAAHKLFPAAKPVLPRRINRNVRSFITLYWDALPFVRADEMGRRVQIKRVILVDTQGLVSVRGMSKKPEVWVIDHHPPGEDLNPDWRFEGDPIGAATTLLVERFYDQGIQLTPIEATLLLLGIYEDTGSLTYSATTARDLRCAAWLREQRADLNVLTRFLHHPLSEEQQKLFSCLQETAETHHLQNQSVVVATAQVAEQVDEISTLAHKMRDLYEPDAIFLLVELEHHIQLVARSTTDTIDVGQVALHFAGGGHSRAAAAIIRDKPLAEARAELLRILPDYVRPVAIVEQIMSHGVATISPDTTIAEAYQRALRLGYEGYPVLDQGRIVGLLTRRAIDRALQHKLDNAAASRFMSSGEVSVRPDDPITKLQALMMESGWGQIPVVSGEDGRLLGVVTRTDVIKLWQPRAEPGERDWMQARLYACLPPAVMELVNHIGQAADDLDLQIYFVGGLVRDILLDIPNMDLDMVVEGDAIALAKKLVKRYGGRIRTHARFGTAKWILEEGFWEQFSGSAVNGEQPPIKNIDFVTARSEFYEHPTALPQVTQSSIKLDLHRRDFTINTLALWLNPDRFGELLDFYGGKRDLESGLVRVLHSLSFIDDPTRILRAVRFEQRLNFRIELRTEELLLESVALLDRVTGDRIRHELELLLREPQPELGFSRLAELGILKQIHPSLIFGEWERQCFERMRELLGDPVWVPEPDDYLTELSYFALLTFRMDLAALEMFERRLRVQRNTAEYIQQLHALKSCFQALSVAQAPSQVYEILEPYSVPVLLIAFVAAEDPLVRDLIDKYVHQWRGITISVSGRELKSMGVPPGPFYGRLLRDLLYARLDGRVSDQQEERAYLQTLLTQSEL